MKTNNSKFDACIDELESHHYVNSKYFWDDTLSEFEKFKLFKQRNPILVIRAKEYLELINWHGYKEYLIHKPVNRMQVTLCLIANNKLFVHGLYSGSEQAGNGISPFAGCWKADVAGEILNRITNWNMYITITDPNTETAALKRMLQSNRNTLSPENLARLKLLGIS